MAASCEPESGYNLPPGCFEGDPRAPWNREEPRTCGECSHLLEGCCDYGICEVEFDRAYANEFGTGDAENSSFGAMWALEWIPNHMRDMQEAACETFESY